MEKKKHSLEQQNKNLDFTTLSEKKLEWKQLNLMFKLFITKQES